MSSEEERLLQILQRRMEPAKVIHEFFRSVLNAMTWVSLCVVVVVVVWRADSANLDVYGPNMGFMFNVVRTGVTIIAGGTSLLLVGALFASVYGVKRDLEVHPRWPMRLITMLFSIPGLFCLSLFVITAMAILVKPVLDAVPENPTPSQQTSTQPASPPPASE